MCNVLIKMHINKVLFQFDQVGLLIVFLEYKVKIELTFIMYPKCFQVLANSAERKRESYYIAVGVYIHICIIVHMQYTYCLSINSWPILYSKVLHKLGQYFFDLLYT